MIVKKQLTQEQALQKIRHYCAYQERCHSEVREKLYSFGLWKKDTELILSQLIEEDYLNEERFAIGFSGGRFRMKHWGRIKIRYELSRKKISEYCIRRALQHIDEADYQRRLKELALDKWLHHRKEKNIFARKRKVQDYLLQKGYEPDLIGNMLREMENTNPD
jgi:regulatory protein